MEQEELTNEERMRLIGSMIRTAQNKFTDNSAHYLLWGYLVALAALLNYALLRSGFEDLSWVPWPILMMAGGIIAGVIGYRQNKRAQLTTYTDRAAGFIWGGMVIVMVVLIIQGAHLGWTLVYPILMLLWGWALFVSGGLIRFQPLIWGGVFNWALGIFAFYQSFDVQLLMIATSMITTYLIPGYMLKLKVKRDAA